VQPYRCELVSVGVSVTGLGELIARESLARASGCELERAQNASQPIDEVRAQKLG